MCFKNIKVIVAISVTQLVIISNASAFDLSDVTNTLDKVNSVTKELNTPKSLPLTPNYTQTVSQPKVLPVTNTGNTKANVYEFHYSPPEDIRDWAQASDYEEYRINAECIAFQDLVKSSDKECLTRPTFPNNIDIKIIVKKVAENYCTAILPGTFQEGIDQETMKKHCEEWRIKENDPVIILEGSQTTHEEELVNSVNDEIKRLTKKFGPISKKTGGLKGFCTRWADANLAPMTHKETYDACIADKGITLEY